MLDATSEVAAKAVVAQITASVQGGDTATGREVIGNLWIFLLLECVKNHSWK